LKSLDDFITLSKCDDFFEIFLKIFFDDVSWDFLFNKKIEKIHHQKNH